METGRLVAARDVKGDGRAERQHARIGLGDGRLGGHPPATALRQLVATRPEFHTNTLIVTHKTNIQDAFGKEWADIKEGECLLSTPGDSANPMPVARIEPTEWIAIAHGR